MRAKRKYKTDLLEKMQRESDYSKKLGLKMSRGILKLLLTIGFLPLILVGMLLVGLIKLAFPILIVVGIIALFQKPYK